MQSRLQLLDGSMDERKSAADNSCTGAEASMEAEVMRTIHSEDSTLIRLENISDLLHISSECKLPLFVKVID